MKSKSTKGTMTGKELRRLRDRLGLTQWQLGERVGISRNSIARQERDEIGIRPPVELLLRILESEIAAPRRPPKKER